MKVVAVQLLLLISYCSSAIDFTLQSSKKQTAVIELFTSEGCSSCPPADKWLSSLKRNKHLWIDFIPVAFHVDYWDYIGWKDEYSLPMASIRQKMHYSQGNIRSVYTPGVIKSGKEWRSWHSQKVIKSNKSVGKLSVSVKNNRLTAQFLEHNHLKELKLTIALLGMNLRSQIQAGENKGKLLKHDFVPLKIHTFNSSQNMWDTEIEPDFFQSAHPDLAFVAWIEADSNSAPIQAVGSLISPLKKIN